MLGRDVRDRVIDAKHHSNNEKAQFATWYIGKEVFKIQIQSSTCRACCVQCNRPPLRCQNRRMPDCVCVWLEGKSVFRALSFIWAAEFGVRIRSVLRFVSEILNSVLSSRDWIRRIRLFGLNVVRPQSEERLKIIQHLLPSDPPPFQQPPSRTAF